MTQQAGAAPVARTVAQFAGDLSWQALPGEVRRESVRAWLNWMGCAIGGAATPAMDAAVRATLAMGARGEVALPGRRERVGMQEAALLSCLASSAHTYDDTHLATITHPTGPVAGAVLAAADRLSAQGSPVDGRALLTALAAGIEVECRLSCAIAEGGADLGWYMTGLSGGVGAAAAVARLLGLGQAAMTDAICIAAAQAGGLRATHGSMAITYVPGMGARNGLASAYLAAAGFTGGAIALDGRNGLLQVLTGGRQADALARGLGGRYEMLANTYKPYPCGIVIHPAIDACLAMAREHDVDPAAIEAIEMRVHPDALNLTWRKLPDNVLDAQVSLFHWVAAALAQRAAGIAQGTLACVRDPLVRALQERASAVADESLAANQAVVALRLRGGARHEHFTREAIGSLALPMTDEQLDAKFREQAEPLLGRDRTAELLDLCRGAPDLGDAAGLLRLAAAGDPASS